MTTPITTTTTVQPTNMGALYFDYIIPMGLKNLIMNVINNALGGVNSPGSPTNAANRMWVSQPRVTTDTTTEVLAVNFEIPVSVSQVSWEALRVSCRYEIWYVDNLGNTRQALDSALNPITLNLSPTSASNSWYSASFQIYPIVCTQLQFRITRIPNIPQAGTRPYVVGMRNTLIKREIYSREQGVQSIPQMQDVMGNVITSYIRDWSPSNAINNTSSSTLYWKSGPQPAANAVVALYLDVRDAAGNGQVIDTVYLDPVYTGNTLNLYYSNDDTVSSLTVSPQSLLPITDVNTTWTEGIGLADADGQGASLYEFPMDWGPLVDQDAWIGVEWTPDFNSIASNSIQVVSLTNSPTGGVFDLSFAPPNSTKTSAIGPLRYDAADLDVQDAFDAVLGAGSVSVLGVDGGPWTIEFQGQWSGLDIPTLGSTNNLIGSPLPEISVSQQQGGGVGNVPASDCVLFQAQPAGIDGTDAVQTMTFTGQPTSGYFLISYDGVYATTVNGPTTTDTQLPYNAVATDILNALNSIPALAGNVSVATPTGETGTFVIQFNNQLADQPVGLLEVESFLPGSQVASPSQILELAGDTGGTYRLSVGGQFTTDISYNSPASVVATALNSIVGETYFPDTQVITVNGSPTGGYFQLSWAASPVTAGAPSMYPGITLPATLPAVFGQPTGTAVGTSVTNIIRPGDPASVVNSALNQLPGLSPDAVTVSGPDGGPYTVEFTGANWTGPQPVIQVAVNALTGGSDAYVSVQHTQVGDVPISVSGPDGGPFLIQVGGNLSGNTSLVGVDYTELTPPGATAQVSYAGAVEVVMSTPGVSPVLNLNTNQYNPSLFYDPGSGNMVLSFDNQSRPAVNFECPVETFSAGTTLRTVAGWAYPGQVSLTVMDSQGNTLGSFNSSAPNLPSQVSVDGTISLSGFRGTFTAHIMKLEDYSQSSPSFLSNAQAYVLPQAVPQAAAEVIPAGMQNAIISAAWTVQQFPNGAGDASKYEAKVWTPILANYLTQKGNLYLPESVNMKYLMLEISNLTAQSYPIYDTGIQVQYQVFPASVTQTSTQPLGQLAQAAGLLTLGADVLLRGMGSVNWLNPQTVSNAVNGVFGQTYQPMVVTTGGATNTDVPAIPNTANIQQNGQARSEVASPWIYKRNPMNAQVLAGQAITAATTTQSVQGLQSSLPVGTMAVGNGITWTPNVMPASTPAQLPVQGDDWWVFPGGTLRMPASVMNGITGNTEVSLSQGLSTTTRFRFTTSVVHTYQQMTATLDAAIAYFAGIRDIQPYRTIYIDQQDPPSFSFTRYDLTQWSASNVTQLDSGPVTTAGQLYQIDNPDFDPDQQFVVGADGLLIDEDSPANDNDVINDWTMAEGVWAWDGTMGASGPLGSASVVADGTKKVLLSSWTYVTPGAFFDLTCRVMWQGLVTGTADCIQVQAWFYEGAPPTPTAPDVVTVYSEQQGRDLSYVPSVGSLGSVGSPYDTESGYLSYLGSRGSLGDVGPSQGLGTLASTGEVAYSTANPVYDMYNYAWVTIGGTEYDGNPFQVPEGATYMRVALVVTPDATAGQVHFDNVSLNAGTLQIGQLYNNFNTFSSFVKLTCTFNDSGTVTSDAMWEVPQGGNTADATNTQLAYYVETIPDIIPAGMWSDTVAEWDDPHVAWGTPRAVVGIQVDPNRTYNGQRVLHFTRALGAGAAGIQMRQQTNFVRNGLCRLGAVFMKPPLPSSVVPLKNQIQTYAQDRNTVQVELVRTSDGLIVHSETFVPPQGVWYTYLSSFFEIPDSDDQIYTLSIVLSGDNPDSMYLTSLFSEIAPIRYFVTLGGAGQYMHDVTPLAYTNGGTAIVGSPNPVTEFDVSVSILAPDAWVYGSEFVPLYLQ